MHPDLIQLYHVVVKNFRDKEHKKSEQIIRNLNRDLFLCNLTYGSFWLVLSPVKYILQVVRTKCCFQERIICEETDRID